MKSIKEFTAFNSAQVAKKALYVIIALLSISIGVGSCKKTVEKKQEDYIMSLITDGRWYVYEFKQEQTDLSSDFHGYEFQFYKNGTVDCITNNNKQTGTWTPDITNYTIAANFPSASYPLLRLNNVWKITDSYTNAVMVESTVGTLVYKMTLVKK
jgi:hypothetical protein